MATREEAKQAMDAAIKELTDRGAHVITIGIMEDEENKGNWIIEADIPRKTPQLPSDTLEVNGVTVRIVDLKIPTRTERRATERQKVEPGQR